MYVNEKGVTFIDLGKRLGVSNKTAHQDVMAVARAYQYGTLGDVELHRTRLQAELNAVKQAHWRKKGTPASGRILLDALAAERRLHALDKALPTGYTQDQFLSFVRKVTQALFRVVVDAEQRRQFAAELRRMLPPAVVTSALQVKDGEIGNADDDVSLQPEAEREE